MVAVEIFDIQNVLKCALVGRRARNIDFLSPDLYPEIQIFNNFMTGHLRTLGQKEGQYPVGYIEFINNIFGPEPNTIEICSRYIQPDGIDTRATVDLNADFKPTYCTQAEVLAGVPSDWFNRVRMDPPYGHKQNKEKYGFNFPPNFNEMLKQASRVCKIGGLIFLLRGEQGGNQQYCKPFGLVRIGMITISCVPNLELRTLNIYAKVSNSAIEIDDNSIQGTLF